MPAQVTASSRFPAQKLENSKTDSVVDASEIVLTTLHNIAQLSAFPYLSQAAGLALGIFNIAKSAKDNKDSFMRLANDACGLVYSVACSLKEMESEGRKVPPSLEYNLYDMLNTLKTVEAFASKHVFRNGVMRIVSYKSDIARIQQYREMMRQALDVFGLQATITIQETVTRIAEQQQQMHEELQQRHAQQSSSTDGSESDIPPKGSFARLVASKGGVFNTINGNQTISSNTNNVTNTNSGNVTTITTTNSNNDSSVRTVGDYRRHSTRGRT